MYWLDRCGDSSTQIYGDGPNLKMLSHYSYKTRQDTHSVMQSTLPDCFLEPRSSKEVFIRHHHLFCLAKKKKKKITEFMGFKEVGKIVNGKPKTDDNNAC